MIRFRHQEDERRWTALRAQIYLRVASNLPTPMIAEVMQNLYKLEEMLLLEGVRQGVACQALSQLMQRDELGTLKPFQLHAHIYGSQDTPLRAAELEHLNRLGLPAETGEKSMLDGKPMRFAPAVRADSVVAAPVQKVSVSATSFEQIFGAPSAALPTLPHPFEDQVLHDEDDPILAALERAPLDDESVSYAEQEQTADDEDGIDEESDDELVTIGDDEMPIGSPAALDRIRDTIQHMQQGGWRPESWPELIMKLHLQLHMDAAYLDLELSTPMGRTVLDQCSLFEIQPGYATSYPDRGR